MMDDQARHFHLVGIGGIGMSAIAEILLRQGCTVSGSDLAETPLLQRLGRLGARIFFGHRAGNLGSAQVVVFSSAVGADNPEIQEAARRQIPVLHRAQMLAELMRNQKAITVAGTHGKTTVTSMIALMLEQAGLDPTVVVGAGVKAFQSNARLGGGEFFVAEADESDRSLLRFWSHCAVVTNIDLDHMDEYADLTDLQQTFLQYMNQVSEGGTVVACADDPNLQPLLKKLHRQVITYGLEQGSAIGAGEVQTGASGSAYECFHCGHRLGSVELKVLGRHNVQNSLAAVAAGLFLQIPFARIAGSLKAFAGADRRMERKGERAGVWVVDDYGHHPAEIRATLEACGAFGRRLVVVFQPHRYSRTQHLLENFGACFEKADRLYLLDIYAAGEQPIPGVTSQKLAQEIRRHRPVTYVPDPAHLLDLLERQTREGDLLLTLGAGDVWKIGENFLAK